MIARLRVKWPMAFATLLAGWVLLFAGVTARAIDRSISDARASSIQRTFDDWYGRIQKLQANPATHGYQLTKAYQWLELARSELSARERGPIIEAAFGQATNLIHQLEANRQNIPAQTPQFPFVASIRPDLWELAEQLKEHPNFAACQGAVASLEVQLVLAAYHYKVLGWRAAMPTLARAEAYAEAARVAAHFQPQPVAVKPRVDPAAGGGGSLDLGVLQDQLRELNSSGVPIRSYAFAKAQHWLDFASAQANAKDRSGIIPQAALQAQLIIQQIQAGNPEAGRDTPLFESVKRIRPDLWELVDEMKKHPSFEAAADRIAQLEVQLIWAGHEYSQLGWRTARAHLAAAERFAKEAQALLGTAHHAVPGSNP